MEKKAKIFVAGHRGMVGSALVRRLESAGYTKIIKRPHSELDFMDQNAVWSFFETEMPDYVFLAAAKVGGINANITYPAEFIYNNLQIQNNIIHSACKAKVKKLLFLGSSCLYPQESPQPIKEEYFLTGPLEPTSAPYAVAKIAGIVLCQSYNQQYGTNFISVVPTNLYGPNDNYDPETSHFIAASIRNLHEAKMTGSPSVIFWGSGKPMREVMHVDDMADACLFLMETYNGNKIVNIGHGYDMTIREIVELVAEVIGYKGSIEFDRSKPDGVPRKLLDVNFLNSLGWKAKIPLRNGIEDTYKSYLTEIEIKNNKIKVVRRHT
jgi:GDP-L-fucose synthase